MQLDFPIRFEMNLDAVQARVLGCMIEKELTTPDYYPITLNALTNACNQKSNRAPKMALAEADVAAAISALRDNALCMEKDSGRAAKYAHKVDRVLGVDKASKALLCELLIRGPQSPGELRTRCNRMASYEDPDAVELLLIEMSERKPALVQQLPRQTGKRDQRWAHLMCGELDLSVIEAADSAPESAPSNHVQQRLEELEARVEALEALLAGRQPNA